MPYKKGSLKGQLTTAEIRKLIRSHNVLVKKSLIKIPAGSSRDQLIKLIDKAGLVMKEDIRMGEYHTILVCKKK